MENASKAVLIAGGVLLALIVISICMFVIYNARDVFTSMEEKRQAQIIQEQQVKFTEYVGNTIYGSEVYNCQKRIESYNDSNPNHIIDFVNNGAVVNDEPVNLPNWTITYTGTMVTNADGTIASIIFN